MMIVILIWVFLHWFFLMCRNLFAIIFFSAAYIFAGAVITEFRADAGFNKVELKWVVSSESGLKGYNVYRSFDGVNFVFGLIKVDF